MSVNEGDIVRVLNIPKEYTEHTYVGAICEVLGVHDSGITVSAPIPSGYAGSQFLVYIADGDYEVITEEDDSMTNTKAQVGDLIRIVSAVEDEPYENGDIFEVTDLTHWDGDVYGFNPKYAEALYIVEEEYTIHRKAGEEDSPEFKRDALRGLQLQMAGHTPDETATIPMQDTVNSPQHYTQGRVEVIDIIEDAVQGADPFEAVCQANIIKYILRYRHKNGITDINKAIWYANKLIAHEQRKIDGK